MSFRRATGIVWASVMLAIFLLAINTLVTTHAIYLEESEGGLLAKLPVTFWIGLSCLGIPLYISRKSKPRTAVVLVFFIIYLYVLPTLISEHANIQFLQYSYVHAKQGALLASEGHLTISTIRTSFLDYRSWPGFLFFVAIINLITGIPIPVLCEYFPFLTISLMGILLFLILRVKLSASLSLFGALWFLSSFWMAQYNFNPSSFAYVIFLTVFLLLAKLFFNKNKSSIVILLAVIILFTAIVFSHLLTTFLTLAGLTLIYFLNKFIPENARKSLFSRSSFILLLAISFVSYQFFVILQTFSSLINKVYQEILSGKTAFSSMIISPRIIGSTNYLLSIIAARSITMINGAVVLFAIFQIIFTRRKNRMAENVFWVAWIIAAGAFGALTEYGAHEALFRAFQFSLVPISYFSIKFLSKKATILIIILVGLCLLHIPAYYSPMTWATVTTTELNGTAFYAQYTSPDKRYFYDRWDLGNALIAYHDPARMENQPLGVGHPPFDTLPSVDYANEQIQKASYVIYSSLTRNYYLYYLGIDLLKQLNLDDQYNRLYDNGHFCIYQK